MDMEPQQRLISDDARRLLLFHGQLRNVWSQLTNQPGFEQEMLAVLDLLDKTRMKWLEASEENEASKKSITDLELEIQELRKNVRSGRAQLNEARAQIATLISEKKTLEVEKAEMGQKMERVKELIRAEGVKFSTNNDDRFAFLSFVQRNDNGASSPVDMRQSFEDVFDDDIDYDKSQESMEIDACSKNSPPRITDAKAVTSNPDVLKSSRPPISVQKKRNRLLATTTITPEDQEHASNIIKRTKRMDNLASVLADALLSTTKKRSNRSLSAPNLLEQSGILKASGICNIDQIVRAASTLSNTELRPPTPTPTGSLKNWTSGTSIGSRAHFFIQKTILMREFCDVCTLRIGFSQTTYKCMGQCIVFHYGSDCKTMVHKQCSGRAALPCVPRDNKTPKAPVKKGLEDIRLADLCPSHPPKVPAVVIHCALALERDHMDVEGLYRVPGSDRLVLDLLDKFQNKRGRPRLDTIHAETMTSTIKKFLNQLRDPIIPRSTRRDFLRAVAVDDDGEELCNAVASLPMPQRDTLAFLCLHWQKVAENAQTNNMPLEALVKCLAPSVVGYSADAMRDKSVLEEERSANIVILSALLNLPSEFWQRFIVVDDKTMTLTPKSAFNRTIQHLPTTKVNPSGIGLTPSRTPTSTNASKRQNGLNTTFFFGNGRKK